MTSEGWREAAPPGDPSLRDKRSVDEPPFRPDFPGLREEWPVRPCLRRVHTARAQGPRAAGGGLSRIADRPQPGGEHIMTGNFPFSRPTSDMGIIRRSRRRKPDM